MSSTPSWVRPRDKNGHFLPVDPNNVKRKPKKSKQQPSTNAAAPVTSQVQQAVSGGQPPAPQVKLKNHIAFVVDRSGSMNRLRAKTVKVFNSLIATVKQKAKETDQETLLSFMSFTTKYVSGYYGKEPDFQYTYFGIPAEKVAPISESDYVPANETPLRDATADMVRKLKDLTEAQDKNTSFLVYILTDGLENASTQFSVFALNTLLNEVQATDRWTIAFMVPPGQKEPICRALNIPEGNVQEWEASDKGMQESEILTSGALRGYFVARASGQTRMQSFFANVADPAEVEKQLQEVTGQYAQWEVDKELPIKEFVEKKLGTGRYGFRTYETGRGFYKLQKPEGEKVQGYKQILLRRKTDKKVFGGLSARKIIGLPNTLEEVKVKPGDHRNFDIFVESTSVNRILPRYQEMLYRVS